MKNVNLPLVHCGTNTNVSTLAIHTPLHLYKRKESSLLVLAVALFYGERTTNYPGHRL